ncbi:pyrimidodiazepine synthase-like isoform X1 [Metopolophium dirhodum]|uniref:pyrimidodiazepine synthase-like isoform X1 n=1 Tax=Metopolophium dirhodum TaxID=44670 RepID=UPI00298F528F|nr:pyrimidodiazepine synthase-like isoform X1 [Metopolophium dirhodum]
MRCSLIIIQLLLLFKCQFSKPRLSGKTTMAIKHLSKDSVEPPKVPGSLRFYSMRFCPYAQRVQLVLNAKGMPHDTVFIDLSDKPEWYLKIYPAGKVPALIYDDKFLSESLLLADFLDKQYPEPPLQTSSPLQTILDKLLIESFGKVGTAFYKLMMTTKEIEKKNFDELIASLIPIETELVERGTKFFGGNKPNMVDYMIWPWFERLDAINPYSNGTFVIPFEDKFPRLTQWKSLMIADKAVAPYYITPEKHAEHFTKKKAGLPAYDI